MLLIQDEYTLMPRAIFATVSFVALKAVYVLIDYDTGDKIPDREEEIRRIMDVDVTDDSVRYSYALLLCLIRSGNNNVVHH